jgi:hypothetical protein
MTKDLELEIQKVDKSFAHYKDRPGFGELLQLLKTYWAEDEGIRENFDAEPVAFIYESLLREILHGVLQKPNPEMALREKLVDVAYTFGCYLSLILSPEPSEDPSGMRNPKIGVTGTLRPYALDLAKVYEEFPNHRLINAEVTTLDEVGDCILFEYLYWKAEFTTLSKLRKVLDKFSNPRPWEYLALEAATSMWEQTHREALGLPYVLDADLTDKLYRRHSNLMQIIRSDAPDPLATWQASVELKEETPAVH